MPYLTLTTLAADLTGDSAMTVFEWLKIFGIVIAAIASVSAVIYSVFNRKHYEAQADTIKEQKELIEVKQTRIATLLDEHTAEIALKQLRITELETDRAAYKRSNQLLVSANLQSAGILKKMRLAGHWDGDENDVFKDVRSHANDD